ncbi:MAG: formate/nitrite transporter family protein [wastewater metagenome]|nr:formate/nitrite transporter family protein [Candidatus Loosdrechtia aerotolerans]
MKEDNIQDPIRVIDIDAYSPSKIATRIGNITIQKVKLSYSSVFLLGALAGIYLGFGAQFSTLVISDSTLHYGFTSLIEGIVYSLGFMLAVIGGAEVFTGNCLGIIGFADKKVTLYELLTNWIVIYIGNLVGSLIMVCWMYETHQWEFFNNMVGAKALLIAHKKVNLSFKTAFTCGVLCNALICLAVWLCFNGRSTSDKIISIVFPIGGFVTSGFEQCVSNMYFIPMGVILRRNSSVVETAEKMTGRILDLSQLTWKGFFINNLLPVTLGNIVGGVILIGIVFWFIYLRQKQTGPNLNISIDKLR